MNTLAWGLPGGGYYVLAPGWDGDHTTSATLMGDSQGCGCASARVASLSQHVASGSGTDTQGSNAKVAQKQKEIGRLLAGYVREWPLVKVPCSMVLLYLCPAAAVRAHARARRSMSGRLQPLHSSLYDRGAR